jgi:hypothetical protein
MEQATIPGPAAQQAAELAAQQVAPVAPQAPAELAEHGVTRFEVDPLQKELVAGRYGDLLASADAITNRRWWAGAAVAGLGIAWRAIRGIGPMMGCTQDDRGY